MKTKFNILAAAILLAAVTAGFGQPSITTQPQHQTNRVGTTATFWVVATGTPTLAHQWQKLSRTWSDLVGCTATNLCLTNIRSSHAGDYRVVITNADGAITSDVATLTVLVPPTITPTTSFQHQAIHVGSNAFFAVTASGTSPLAYQWQLDGHDLADQTNSTINFNPTQPADEGDYTVVVTNVAGAATSEPARLWVVPPPSAFIRGDFTNGTFRFPYYYLMPTNYTPDRSYPLVCFFHGACGDEFTFTNGGECSLSATWPGYANLAFSKVLASYRQQTKDPAIVLWPTRRRYGESWDTQYERQATNLLDYFIARFNIDTNRVYIGGGSGGLHPAWDVMGLRRSFFAGAILEAGAPGGTPATSIKDTPIWAFCSWGDELGHVGDVEGLVLSLRLAGGNPLCTEYASGRHLVSIAMADSTPAVVDWLLAQRRAVAPTNEPLLCITSPTSQAVLFTGACNLNVAGFARALGQTVTKVAWENRANYTRGNASGSKVWNVAAIPLVANRTNLIIVTGTTTSWAPAFGGFTTFNDTLSVIQSPIQATLTCQGTDLVLSWTGGGPPYRVQRATDLTVGDWTEFPTNATPPVSLPVDGAASFYRVLER